MTGTELEFHPIANAFLYLSHAVLGKRDAGRAK